MKEINIQRRDFLKKTSTVLTAMTAFTALSSIQSTFAYRLSKTNTNLDDENSFAKKREDYLLDPNITYFNHGSIGTIPRLVLEAHKGYLEICESNPWLYMWSDPWEEAREKTRVKVANFLRCDNDEIAITHNTTEGFNLLANGLPLSKGDEVVFSSLNHIGASQCWFHYAQSKDFSVKKFKFPIEEIPNLSKDDIISIYEKNISEKTRVLVFPHIDNLVGLRYPVKEIATMARKKGVQYIAVDGAQSVGMIPVNIKELGVDFYATSSHKWIQAPKGTGILYISKEKQSHISPMWVTFGQKKWEGTVRIFEDYGTRNLAAVLPLGDAIDYQNTLDLKVRSNRLKSLWSYFFKAVENNSKIIWRSPKKLDLSTSLFTIEVKNKNSNELFNKMYQEHNFVFRPFHSTNWNTLRISPNIYNTFNEIDRFIELLVK